jgi:hypothetical protein
MVLKHPAAYDNGERAHRLYKQIKAGVREFEELDLEEAGLVLIHYPHLLRCSGCGSP